MCSAYSATGLCTANMSWPILSASRQRLGEHTTPATNGSCSTSPAATDRNTVRSSGTASAASTSASTPVRLVDLPAHVSTSSAASCATSWQSSRNDTTSSRRSAISVRFMANVGSQSASRTNHLATSSGLTPTRWRNASPTTCGRISSCGIRAT